MTEHEKMLNAATLKAYEALPDVQKGKAVSLSMQEIPRLNEFDRTGS